MKNLYLLKTDKISKLVHDTKDNLALTSIKIVQEFSNKKVHIYITSDEEIKEGDWLIVNDEDVMQMKSSYDNDMSGEDIWVGDSLNGYTTYKDNCKKIILTTDQDLIKDGVQAIDDEFLEWFIKNPNCEDVEVEIICGVCGVEGREDEIDVCGRSKECARGWISDKYKIIIPRKIIQTYEINDLKEAFLKGYVAKNNKEDYPFAVQKFLNSKLNENKK